MVKINFSDWVVPDGLSITDSWCGTAFRKDMLIPCLQQEPDNLVLGLMVDGPGSGGLPLSFLKAALSGLQVEFPNTQILPECARREELDVAMAALGENPEEPEEAPEEEPEEKLVEAPVTKETVEKFLGAILARNPSIWTRASKESTYVLADGAYRLELSKRVVRPKEFRVTLTLYEGYEALLAVSGVDFAEVVALHNTVDARYYKVQKALNHFVQT